MHAKGNITCKSTVEKLHIWGSPAWILENLMFSKCLGESSIFFWLSMKKSADRKSLFLGWAGYFINGSLIIYRVRDCLHGGGGPQVSEGLNGVNR